MYRSGGTREAAKPGAEEDDSGSASAKLLSLLFPVGASILPPVSFLFYSCLSHSSVFIFAILFPFISIIFSYSII
jgi:hypothetical protein